MFKQQMKSKKMQWPGVMTICMNASNQSSKNQWLFKYRTKKSNKEFNIHGCTQEMENTKSQRKMDMQMECIKMRIKSIFKNCSNLSKKDSSILSQSMICKWGKELFVVIENIMDKDSKIFLTETNVMMNF